MPLTQDDLDQIQRMIFRELPKTGAAPSARSAAEAGSPEFAEDRTQVNSLNNKLVFDAYFNLGTTAASRSQTAYDNLQAISLRALNNSVDLTEKISARTLAGLDQAAVDLASINAQKLRLEADNGYVTRYDLSNPVAVGAADTLTSAAYTPNRTTDTAAAGVAAAVTESVQTNVTAQVAEIATQVATLVGMAQAQTTALQALADSNALIASALSALAPKA